MTFEKLEQGFSQVSKLETSVNYFDCCARFKVMLVEMLSDSDSLSQLDKQQLISVIDWAVKFKALPPYIILTSITKLSTN